MLALITRNPWVAYASVGFGSYFALKSAWQALRLHSIDVNFLTYDTPVAKFSAPSAALNEEKKEWGAVRAARWFGR